jgi:hypothetical protein
MIKYFKNNPKIHSIVVKVISSIIFALLFIFILVIAETQYPNKVLCNMKHYVDTYLLMGLK